MPKRSRPKVQKSSAKKKPKTTSAVRLKYEPEYDLLSVWLGDPQPLDQVEVESGVYVRVSRESHLAVGLEILEAGARFHKDEEGIRNPAFARTLLEKYGPKAAPATA